MARIHLIEGPVGAGKSTYAADLGRAQSAPHLDLDDWMARLFRPDRPESGLWEWYAERKERCIEQIWRVASQILASDTDVVLELGLVRRSDRESFYERAAASPHELTVHVLEADRTTRRERVRQRNLERGDTYSMDVPDEVFELASDLWEPLDELETEGRDVRFVPTDG